MMLTLILALVTSQTTLPTEPSSVDPVRTRMRAAEALTYCTAKNFNTDYCILIDMSIHSGLKRLFIWDFKGDSISDAFLVGHGCCDGPWALDNSKENPRFSNVSGSHCSSLGKYRIGQRGQSDWGIGVKYVLHGLEPTNSNAQSRFIVFHSWERVTDDEIHPHGTAEGWGCPTVSDHAMRKIDPKLKASEKPVLMWIYE